MVNFRGFANNKWHYGGFYQFTKDVGFIIQFDGENHFNEILVKNNTVGMSWGLKDRNEKEIFGSIEVGGKISKGGDIINTNCGIYQVIFRDAMFELTNKNLDEYVSFWQVDYTEVLGNQLDNPELLEEKK